MSDYYLKILSGNHLGAEIPLGAGQYALGKGEHCDLILTDDSLAELEFVLAITDEGAVSIKMETEKPIFLNGVPSGQAINLDHFDVFTISGIHFAFGAADSPWPSIEIPDLQKPEEQAIEDNNSEFPDPDTGDIFSDNNNSEENFGENIEEYYEKDEESVIDKRWLIGIPLGFVIFITIFGILLFSGNEKPIPVANQNSLGQATLITKQLNLPDIKLRQLADGTLLVSGYTQTLDKKENLIKKIRDKNIIFRSQVIVMKNMRENAQSLLQSRGYKGISIEIDNTPGSLILTGYVISEEQIDKVISLLKEEIYGLHDVINLVENQADRIKVLKGMIKDKGLASRVYLTQRPSKILVHGLLLDSDQQYKLQEVIGRFKSKYDNQPAIIIDTKASRTAQQNSIRQEDDIPIAGKGTGAKLARAPSVTVRGVSMGPIPYVIMADGGKYLLGSKLDNGYIIEDINLDYLLLSSNSQKIKYHLGGKANDQRAK